jgi:hypothetical protein
MKTILKDEVLKHVSESTLNNIINRTVKCIGIRSLSKKENANKKRVGKIIMIYYSDIIPKEKHKKSLLLDMIVEYKNDKIKWHSSEATDKSGFHLVDPYYVKPYKIEPKLNVPVSVYKRKSNSIETEMVSYTYKQFQERRLDEYFIEKKWLYKGVKAYKNFRKMFASTGQYYMAINSTVKHCMISQGALEHILGMIDAKKKQIKNEWTKYMQAELSKKQFSCDVELDSSVVEVGYPTITTNHDNIVKFRSS